MKKDLIDLYDSIRTIRKGIEDLCGSYPDGVVGRTGDIAVELIAEKYGVKMDDWPENFGRLYEMLEDYHKGNTTKANLIEQMKNPKNFE